MNPFLLALCAASLSVSNVAGMTPDATVRVDASKVEANVTPWLYGACIEDVNHEIYGGLYDQRLFGESFEEPVPDPAFVDASVHGGSWTLVDGEIRAEVYPEITSEAELIRNLPSAADGLETEIRFLAGGSKDYAGFLVRASDSDEGLLGYEIRMAADGRRIRVGRRGKRFEQLGETAADCDPSEWNRLGLTVGDGRLCATLNGKTVLTFEDAGAKPAGRKVALRTKNARVGFRDVRISDGGGRRMLTFRTTPAVEVSRQWSAFSTGDAEASYRHLTGDSFNGVCAQHMAFVSGTGTVGLANGGLNGWGIAVRAGQTFAGRLWLKGRGEVVVALQSADGKREYASRRLTGLGAEWRCFPFELTASATDDRARFALLLDRPGSIEVDQASLMSTGADRFRGLPVRGDIGEAMVDEGLTFLRYGGTMVNAEGYRFKKMIGDRDRRPPYRGHWYRYSTNGFGIEEFVQFCEKAGFEAAFAVNIEETPEDMADMVEYLNGPADSEWGRRRAANGHPEPYGVRYIGIGNEEVFFNGDRGDEYDHYVERFLLLHDAIKAVDPSVQLVATAWWRPDSPHMERTFRALDGKADFWDYHPWANQLSSGRKTGRELQRMYELFHEWNPATKMRCAIFEENGDSHDMLRVLGHVTIQNAVRRMGDFVLTSCAANALQPYGQNDNGWDQGQLFFTPSRVWGMPPYHAQRMASTYHQPLLVGCRTTGAEKVLDVTATRSRDAGRLVLHMVNTGAEPLRVNLQVEGFGTVASARRISLAGGLNAVNTPEEPQRVVPQEDALAASADQSCEVEPYSYTIVGLDRRS